MLNSFKNNSLLFSVIMMSFILTSAQGMQLAAAQPGMGTMFGSEAGGGATLHTINPANGASVPVGPFIIASGIGGLAKDLTTGIMYASGGGGQGGDIFTVNQATGALTLVGNSGFIAVQDLAVDNSGTLYATTTFSGPFAPTTIVTINKANGIGTSLPNPTGIDGIEAIAFAPSGTLYGATKTLNVGTPQGDELFTIDVTTGLASPVAPIRDVTGAPHPGGVIGLQFGCDGTLYGSTGQGGQLGFSDLLTINPTTGVFTVVGQILFTGSSVSDLTFDDSCVFVGGELVPIGSASLLIAGTQLTAAWLIPAIVSAVGIGLVISRKI